MPRSPRPVAALLLAISLLSTFAIHARAAGNPDVTRRDLAEAYLRLETILAAHPIPQGRESNADSASGSDSGSERARVHRAFDAATLDFFAGRSADAIRKLDELATSLLPEKKRTLKQRILSALRVRATPRHVVAGDTSTSTRIRIEPTYPLPVDATVDRRELAVELVFTRNGSAVAEPMALKIPLVAAAEAGGPGPPPVEIEWQPEATAGTGRVDVALRAGDITSMAKERIAILPRPLDEIRETNRERLRNLPKPPAGEAAAHVSCWSRNELLAPQADESNSARFLVDLAALASDVSSEIDALAAGRNPYADRPGDVWRKVPTSAGELPVRVFVPKAATDPERDAEEKLPLVIALHGAGGDENMFFDAYGKGQLVELAEERGFVALSPRAYGFTWNPAPFVELVDLMIAEQRVDPDRVYLIGHSMGTGAAAAIARTYPDRVAAVACIAGGGGGASASGPRTLMVAGGLDPLANAERTRGAVKRASDAGAEVQLRVEANAGHSLVVGECLGDVVAWLLGD